VSKVKSSFTPVSGINPTDILAARDKIRVLNWAYTLLLTHPQGRSCPRKQARLNSSIWSNTLLEDDVAILGGLAGHKHLGTATVLIMQVESLDLYEIYWR
jgi:hypothetical protein